MRHDSAAQSPVTPGQRTWHLTPRDVWKRQVDQCHYVPEAFVAEGFIHCTNDLLELVAAGNKYYRDDPRPFVAVEIECDLVEAQIVYEDAARMFPHIYGQLNPSAILRACPCDRDVDGVFVTIAT